MTVSVRLPDKTQGVDTLMKRLHTNYRVTVEVFDGHIKLSGGADDLHNAQNYCLKFIGPETVLEKNISHSCFKLFHIPSFLRHFEEFFKIIIYPESYGIILIKGSKENIASMHPYLTALDEYSIAPNLVPDEIKVTLLKTLCEKFHVSFEELPEDNILKLSLLSYLSSIVGKSFVGNNCKEPVPYIEAYRRQPTPSQITGASPYSGILDGVQTDTCIYTKVTSTINQQGRPSTNSEPSPRRLRAIVIDGSNVAFAHGCQNHFSSDGILLAINYFLKRGHTSVVAVVPRFRRRLFSSTFDKLERAGRIAYTPARFVDNTQQVADDDSFILRLALETDAVIVSNDQFRNHRDKGTEFKDLIDKRLLQYTLALDTFLVADDPLGRDGPSLSEFLSHPEPNS